MLVVNSRQFASPKYNEGGSAVRNNKQKIHKNNYN